MLISDQSRSVKCTSERCISLQPAEAAVLRSYRELLTLDLAASSISRALQRHEAAC